MRLLKWVIGLCLGAALFITDSAIFKLFVELLIYLLGFFLFLLFTWLMVTQGTVWSFP
jgi:hypothetical protein